MDHLVLHIIYMPRSVFYLRCFIVSFLDKTSVKICVVSNGLSDLDVGHLYELAEEFPRVFVVELRTDRPLPHGFALNELWRRCPDEWFLFSDHDVLLTGSIESFLGLATRELDVFSCGDRIENIPGIRYGGFSASSTAHEGMSLATSFFAGYRTNRLASVSQQYDIGFEQAHRFEQVPASLRKHFGRQHFSLIDTGKLLSVALNIEGARPMYFDLPEISHLGALTKGFSILFEDAKRSGSSTLPTARECQLLPVVYCDQSSVVLRRNNAERHNRNAIALYFAAEIASCLQETGSPSLVGADEVLALRISALVHEIRGSIEKFKSYRFAAKPIRP